MAGYKSCNPGPCGLVPVMSAFLASFALVALASMTGVTGGDAILSAYTAPGEFPTSVYASYWNNPTATSAQPQPVISDPVTVCFRNITLIVSCD